MNKIHKPEPKNLQIKLNLLMVVLGAAAFVFASIGMLIGIAI